MGIRYRVLLVEDCLQDALFNLNALERGGLEVESERVETAAQMEDALQRKRWDFVLCDYHLRDFNGLGALALYKQSGVDIPFIVVSGMIGEEQAVELVKAGAHEYVMKDSLAKLVPAVRRELEAAEERWVRRRTHQTEAFLASIVAHCCDAIFGETLDGRIVSWNLSAERIYGYTASQIIGERATILEPQYRPGERQAMIEKIQCGEPVANFETVHVHKNGTAVEVSLAMSPVREQRGRIIGTSTIVQDITAWKQADNERLELIQDLTTALALAAEQDAACSNLDAYAPMAGFRA